MSKRQETEYDLLLKSKIEDLLRKTPSESLIGVVIHRVLNGESEFDLTTLLKNLVSQAEVDEGAVINVIGEDLLREIKAYVQRQPG